MHIDGDIGRRTGKIDKTKPSCPMHNAGNLMIRRADAAYIRTRCNGCNFDLPVFVLFKEDLQVLDLNQTIRRRWNDLNIANGFNPGSLVGVVLHMGHEYNGALFFSNRNGIAPTFRHPKTKNALKLVDDARHPGSIGNDTITRSCIYMLFDDLAGFVVSLRHRCTGNVGFRMGIAKAKRPQIRVEFSLLWHRTSARWQSSRHIKCAFYHMAHQIPDIGQQYDRETGRTKFEGLIPSVHW